jgi:hypothetical protein
MSCEAVFTGNRGNPQTTDNPHSPSSDGRLLTPYAPAGAMHKTAAS